MTKCYFCKGRLQRKRVDIARYWGEELIALKNVPAFVCSQCSERFFEAKVSKKIDQKIQQVIKNKAVQDKIDVPIVLF